MSDVVQVRLPSGDVVWARVAVEDDGPADVGFADRSKVYHLDGLVETVRGVAESIRDGLRHFQPDDVTVQFGIEVSGKTGKVVSVLAQAGAKATLTVTLKWKGGGGRDDRAETVAAFSGEEEPDGNSSEHDGNSPESAGNSAEPEADSSAPDGGSPHAAGAAER
ncbi:CU044_2847 family protein [Gandjariella thermophila]|uniref:Trypsin-co-occurring domain-containing protein n=1 Tax=Gandjariella thermophila TaxID=1931992 RepID=A0A4D4J7E9_9PSEU|nr:CU044_2847 family protein [Gandjariella thermophila]GDY29877.1 hypothetical protein GTS_15100 [Gandjariella thermophila]